MQRRLREEAVAAGHLAGGNAGEQFDTYHSRYLAWVATTGEYLESEFDDRAAVSQFLEHQWELRRTTSWSPRPVEVITTETRRQQRQLEALAARLECLLAGAAAAPGRLAVLDTNVFLHHEHPAHVDWSKVVGAEQVRLVVPLRVLEELDEKKYTARDQLADRARSILSSLWQCLRLAVEVLPCCVRHDHRSPRRG